MHTKADEILGILKEYVWHGKLTSWLMPVYITVPLIYAYLCQRMENASDKREQFGTCAQCADILPSDHVSCDF
jgi:hypothetical protein